MLVARALAVPYLTGVHCWSLSDRMVGLLDVLCKQHAAWQHVEGLFKGV
jgi:hypothetical protein